jgi:DNA-binding response OmpR family regulator
MPNTRKILIVDDDPEMRDALTEQLSLHDEFEALAVENGSKGLQAAKAGQIDLVIMDVGLPDIDGREAVRILRKNGFKAPIIMLTGHDTDADTILGLESGANDYVTKPFRFVVLLAHIRAQLRQYEASEDVIFTIGPYAFRPSSKLLLNSQGTKVRLTERETSVLRYPLPRRPAAGIARDAVAGGLGLQFGSNDAHAGNAHLPVTAEDREGRRRSHHPCHRGWRVQAGAVIAMK